MLGIKIELTISEGQIDRVPRNLPERIATILAAAFDELVNDGVIDVDAEWYETDELGK